MLEPYQRNALAMLLAVTRKRLPEEVEQEQSECPKGDVRGNIAANLELLFYSEAVFHVPSLSACHSSANGDRSFDNIEEMPTLSATELRVLGALIEKGITTPEYYPLSLNALVNACNQKSSRDPVMELSEADVRSALFEMEQLGLVRVLSDARVSKFEHLAYGKLSLGRPEIALLGLLLLRGPQTPAELRARAERMYTFDDTAAVTTVLDRLAAREEPLVVQLGRQPGARESRWAQLLGGPVETGGPASTTSGDVRASEPGLGERVAALEETVRALEERLKMLEAASQNP